MYFQPGSNPDTAVGTIANLATAQLRRLPPGTLPPVVLKFDASSLPVCLVTLKGEGLTKHSSAISANSMCAIRLRTCPARRFRNPLAGVTGRSWSTSIRYKLEAHQTEPDGCRPLRQRLQSDPAGRRREIGPFDYSIYTNSQLPDISEINHLPLKTVGKPR